MDPDIRPSCSNLLQHPLFTQDNFAEKFLIDIQINIAKENARNPLIQKRIDSRKLCNLNNTAETPRTYGSAGR